MDISIALLISIISIAITIANFYLSRKDKAIKDKEEEDNSLSDQKLIDYRLKKVEDKLDKILDILDSYENEVKKIVKEELAKHVLEYHHKGE